MHALLFELYSVIEIWVDYWWPRLRVKKSTFNLNPRSKRLLSLQFFPLTIAWLYIARDPNPQLPNESLYFFIVLVFFSIHAQIKITSHIKLLTLFTASKVYTTTTTGNTEKFDFCAGLAYQATTTHGASKVFLIL